MLAGLLSHVSGEAIAEPTTWWLKRMGYDHAERVGCMPREEVFYEFPELRIRAATRSDCMPWQNGSKYLWCTLLQRGKVWGSEEYGCGAGEGQKGNRSGVVVHLGNAAML